MTSPGRARLGILISGRGSNMVALAEASRDGRIPGDVALVVSNVLGAPGLAAAARMGLETAVIQHDGLRRAEHDARVARALDEAGVDLICLAGYMRLVGAAFVRRHEGRLLNIHPSLLPAFPGQGAQRQALEHGVRVTGCTVHFVDEALDHGAIVLQEAVPVLGDDDVASLSARILAAEHRAYPEAVALVASGRVTLVGGRARRTA